MSKRPSSRYLKVAERRSGSKTRLTRSKRLLAVHIPIRRDGDANCCPTGGTRTGLYRVERSRVVKVGTRILGPVPTVRGG